MLAPRLSAARLFVVEDDPLLARDLRDGGYELGAAHCSVVSFAAVAEHALPDSSGLVALIEASALAGEGTSPEEARGAADALRRAGVPILSPRVYRDAGALRTLTRSVPDGLLGHGANESGVHPGIAAAVASHRRSTGLRRADREEGEPSDVEGFVLLIAGDGSLGYGSPPAASALRRGEDALAGENLYALLHPEDRPEVRGAVRAVVSAGEPRQEVAMRIGDRTGGWVHARLDLHRTRAGDGVIAAARAGTAARSIAGAPGGAGTSPRRAGGTGHVRLDLRGEILEASPSVARMLGYESADDLLGANIADYFRDETRRVSLLRRLRRSGVLEDVELSIRWGEDRRAWVAADARLERTADAASRRVAARVTDITHQKAIEHAQARLAAIVETSRDAIIGKDLDGTITSWNRGAERMYGWSAEEAVGRHISLVVPPDREEELEEIMARIRSGERVEPLETHRVTKDGDRLEVSLALSPIEDAAGRLIGASAIGRDITERKRLQRKLEQLAFEDPLTGLVNRRVVEERAEQIFALADRQEHAAGVVHLDLVGFKRINDTLGHTVGDRVLVEMADRLEEQARASDVVARMGGDEFLVLLSEIEGADGALALTGRLARELEQPLETGAGTLNVQARFGIALYPEHGDSIRELISAADHAMYSADRARGRGRVRVFEPDTGVEMADSPPLEMQLDRALEEGELQLHYQPIYRVSDLETAGAEALVRWQHPEKGLLAAAEFIDGVERMGRATELDLWVLEQVLADGGAPAADRSAAGDGTWTAVNLSGDTLGSGEAVDRIEELLRGSPEAASRVVLEITEQSTLVRPTVAADRLDRLRRTRARVALDDFGTGHSSLAYLEQLPVDQLKLDRFFLDQLERRVGSENFTSKIIELGHALELEVVLEGIEEEMLFDWARDDGADYMQGYYLGRPVPGDGWADLPRTFDRGPARTN